jgi:hypothetical protein
MKMAGSVQVGCKIPNGLQLNLYGKAAEETFVKDKIVLNGAHGTAMKVGVTEVPKEFWDAWLTQNKNHPSVKAEFIFAFGDNKSVNDKAKEMMKEKTGFEGLDPHKPAAGIEPEESMKKILSKVES